MRRFLLKVTSFRADFGRKRAFGCFEMGYRPVNVGNRVYLGMPFAVYDEGPACHAPEPRPADPPGGSRPRAQRYGIVLGPDDEARLIVRRIDDSLSEAGSLDPHGVVGLADRVDAPGDVRGRQVAEQRPGLDDHGPPAVAELRGRRELLCQCEVKIRRPVRG